MLNFYTSHECPHYKYENVHVRREEREGDSGGRDKEGRKGGGGGGGKEGRKEGKKEGRKEKEGRGEGGWEAQSLMSFFWDAAAWVIE